MATLNAISAYVHWNIRMWVRTHTARHPYLGTMCSYLLTILPYLGRWACDFTSRASAACMNQPCAVHQSRYGSILTPTLTPKVPQPVIYNPTPTDKTSPRMAPSLSTKQWPYGMAEA